MSHLITLFRTLITSSSGVPDSGPQFSRNKNSIPRIDYKNPAKIRIYKDLKTNFNYNV